MNQPMNQLSAGDSLFSSVRWPKARNPRRAEVLAVLELVIPWAQLDALVRPHYRADAQRTGRRGYSLPMLIRCRVLQIFWRLSDDGVEALVLDSHSSAKFIGSDPWQPRPPSSSKVREFRTLLKQTGVDIEFELAIELAFIGAGLQFRIGCVSEPVFRHSPKRKEDD